MVILSGSLELKKPCSSKESGILGELTNRVSARSQSNFTYHSKSLREQPSQNTTLNKQVKQGSKNSI